MNDDMKRVAPKLDLLLSLDKVVKSSIKAVQELQSEALNPIAAFLTAARDTLDNDDKESEDIQLEAGALCRAANAIEAVPFKQLEQLLTKVGTITAQIEEISLKFNEDLGISEDLETHSEEDPLIAGLISTSWDEKNPDNLTESVDPHFINLDSATGDGYIIASVLSADGEESLVKVIVENSQSIALEAVEDDLIAALSDDDSAEEDFEILQNLLNAEDEDDEDDE